MITQEDRELFQKLEKLVFNTPKGAILDGESLYDIAAHRIAAELRGMERAAVIADEREAQHLAAWYKEPNTEAKCNLVARVWEAHDIAAAIRTAKEA